MKSALLAQAEISFDYRKSAGVEPLPGYRLVRPLGRGGYGEVWECEAPGGLRKAVKFVFADADRQAGGAESLRQEFEAIEQVKAIRHPFLITLERVELVGGELVVVMELADRNLHDRFEECRARGMPGIPRDELCGYLADVAEALDLLGTRYGLQHLDVKPANLFLVGVHAKIGDYGLVSRQTKASDVSCGLTPQYAPPEVLDGRVDPRSDQYSLALVYCELLTGSFPFALRSARHLILQHAVAPPDLSALPPAVRPAVARALAKKPADRHPSCVAFVEQLLAANEAGACVGMSHTDTVPDLEIRRSRMTRSQMEINLDDPSPVRGRGPVRLEQFQTVFSKGELLGDPVGAAAPPLAAEFAAAVVRVACRASGQAAVNVTRTPDGAWVARFPVLATREAVAPVLDRFERKWQVTREQPDEVTVVFRREQPQGLLGRLAGRSAGAEVVVRFPPANTVGESVVIGRTFGPVDEEFTRVANGRIPQMVKSLCRRLQNHHEKRAGVRVPATFEMEVYPVAVTGEVHPMVPARGVDVSLGGVGFEVMRSIPTPFAYVAFVGLGATSDWAILTRLVRTQLRGTTQFVGGRYLFPAGAKAK